jgi:hypothetical protein
MIEKKALKMPNLGKCFLIVDFLKPKIEVAAIEFLVRGSFTEFS